MKFGFGNQIWVRDNHSENFYRMLDDLALEGVDGTEVFMPYFYDFFGSKPQEIRKLLEIHDLELADHYVGVCFRDEDLHKETLAKAKVRWEFSAEVGAKYALMDEAFGDLPLKGSLSDHIKRVAECANKTGEWAKSLGLTVAWHNHWGNTFETQEPLEEFIGLLDEDSCGICFDTGQLKLGGINEVEMVKKYVNKIKFMHYKDVTFKGRPNGKLYPGGFDVPTDTGAYSVDAKGRWVELGRGEVDFVGVTKVLKAAGYDGWIVDDLDSTSYAARDSLHACKDYINNGLGIWTEKDIRTGKVPKNNGNF
jgi:inosose dehydratase